MAATNKCLIKGSRVLTLDKLTFTEIYYILISKVQNKPSSYFYFENLFDDNDTDWAAIYILPHVALYKKLHIFGIKPSPLCSFFNLRDETSLHIFYECDCIECLWSDLVQYFQKRLVLRTLTPQTVVFGLLDSQNSDPKFKKSKILINQILLLFKLYLYRSREKQFININYLILEIESVKIIEKEMATSNSKKTIAFNIKWHITNGIISITSMNV